MPDLSLYQAYTAAVNEFTTVEAEVQATLAAVKAKVDAAKAALVASLPEGVKFATTPDAPPTISHVAGEIVVEHAPFLGDPIPEPVAPTA
jgi:hypothetical protein